MNQQDELGEERKKNFNVIQQLKLKVEEQKFLEQDLKLIIQGK